MQKKPQSGAWKFLCLLGWLVVLPAVTAILLILLMNSSAENRRALHQIQNLEMEVQLLSVNPVPENKTQPQPPLIELEPPQSSQPVVSATLDRVIEVIEEVTPVLRLISHDEKVAKDIIREALEEKQRILDEANRNANRILSRARSLARRQVGETFSEALKEIIPEETPISASPKPTPQKVGFQGMSHPSLKLTNIRLRQQIPEKPNRAVIRGTLVNDSDEMLESAVFEFALFGSNNREVGEGSHQVESMGPRGQADFLIETPISSRVTLLKITRLEAY